MHERARQIEGFERDREYVARFVDPEVVGDFLGEGSRSRVYELKDSFSMDSVHAVVHNPDTPLGVSSEIPEQGMVIKVPRTESVIPPTKARQKLRKFAIGFRYFSPFVARPTYLLERGHDYCILQRRLQDYEFITKANLETVRNSVEDVFRRHRELVANGMYMDILGREGLISGFQALYNSNITPKITNLVIEHTREGDFLRIIDISIFKTGDQFFSRRNPISRIEQAFHSTSQKIDTKLIRHHFGLEFGG